jgi:hypothetical protein
MTDTTEPDGFGVAGRALWLSIAPAYTLRPDEVARLTAACRTADVIALLEMAWQRLDFPMVSRGSMGQEVIHPLIGELRTQRAAFDSMLRQLKLPDLDDAPAVNQNRSAAQDSWKPSAARSGRGA